ncbi:hypothetical protein [Paractinoplanes toevensis]|uniref:DUF5666 domain-containing protein n=1 Tax=Paractinoplanes toevensis TaxID=571911 RepID=A0A919W3Z3_9ACTN|nr:hypothetical protein [Actinoplanes toevensis]GIM91040.1 hypothetical protein Ato02nite_028330 [Actinoplanes toevensis]
MRFRRIAVAAALVTAVVIPAAATVAVAAPAEHTAAHQDRSRPSRFSTTGTVTAVSGRTVTIKPSGKSAALTVTVTANAKIRVNGKTGKVADLGAGFGITVNGTRSGTDYLASRVEARGKKTQAGPAVRPSPSASATHHARDDD